MSRQGGEEGRGEFKPKPKNKANKTQNLTRKQATKSKNQQKQIPNVPDTGIIHQPGHETTLPSIVKKN